jgi:hypothetical protein
MLWLKNGCLANYDDDNNDDLSVEGLIKYRVFQNYVTHSLRTYLQLDIQNTTENFTC